MTRLLTKPIIVLGMLALTAVGGCQTVSKRPSMALNAPDVPITVNEAAIAAAPKPKGTRLRDVRFKVYTGPELEALVTEIKAGRRKDVVIIGLTPDGYKNLSTNIAELERYIREQKQLIVYLRKLGSHRRPGSV